MSASTFGCESKIEYSHFSLCEYSAAQYVSHLNEADFKDWFLAAKEDFRWRAVILFSSGLGMGEKIINLLIESYDSGNSGINYLALATEAAKEFKDVSLDLLKNLTDRILPSLNSAKFVTVFEGTKALLNIVPEASGYINELVKPLLESNRFSTRLAAVRLTIACSEKDIDLEKTHQIIQELLSEPVRPDLHFPILITPDSKQVAFTDETKRKCEPTEWIIRNEILLHGSQLLLKHRGDIDIANQTWIVISQDYLDFANRNILEKSLLTHIQEKLKIEKNNKDLDDYKVLLSKIYRDIYKKIIEFDKSDLSGGFLSAEPNLKRLKDTRKDRAADLVFLESILRVTQNSQEEFHKYSTPSHGELVSLGILFKGMGWWDIPHNQWTQLHDSPDYDVIDVILKGMITVLDINKNSLRSESLKVINDINRFLDLDFMQIESLLKSETMEDVTEVIYYLLKEVYQDKDSFLGLVNQIPKVPIEFKWERINNIQLSAQALVSAIQYPSLGISQNAALLIRYGAGGEEAIKLVKELAGVDEWEAFQKTLPDIWEKRSSEI